MLPDTLKLPVILALLWLNTATLLVPLTDIATGEPELLIFTLLVPFSILLPEPTADQLKFPVPSFFKNVLADPTFPGKVSV